jgi:thymidylate synthase ThyX
MAFEAKVLADSRSPAGHRLTTLEATFPRFVLAEFNTHRVFSRNSASSRAIPIVKQLRRVLEDPYVPIEFGSNQPGMQAGPALTGEKQETAEREWLNARDDAVRRVLGLVADPAISAGADLLEALEQVEAAIRDRAQPDEWLNVHKQVANRLLEPFMWHTVIVTATEWDNFWNLRCHPDAQPEIRLVAERMRTATEASDPADLGSGEWHLPLIRPEDREEVASTEDLIKVSAGRCARVSYLTHAGKRDLGADIELHDRLLESGHMSPLEHPARPLNAAEIEEGEWSGNFRGWRSYRKEIAGEENPLGPKVPARAAPSLVT